MDDDRYDSIENGKLREDEAKCRQCGLCCGAFGHDPCFNLVESGKGRYSCAVYENRLGPQKTVSGNIFTCVTIRDVQKFDISYPGCGYNKLDL